MLLVVFILLTICAWYFAVEPILILIKTNQKQMFELSNSVVAFSTINNRLPRSLEEMVAAGVLPTVGTIYFSPLLHDSLSLKEVPYQKAEFEFEFTDDKATVMIPTETYRRKQMNWRYKLWLPTKHSLEVLRGTRFDDLSVTNRYKYN